jgi:hypothetical protein
MMLWRFSDNKETNDEISALHLLKKKTYEIKIRITLSVLK